MPVGEHFEFPKVPWTCPIIRPDGSVCGIVEPTASNAVKMKRHCRRCGREKAVAASLANYYRKGNTKSKNKRREPAEPMGVIVTKGRTW